MPLRVPKNFSGAHNATSLITHMGQATTTLCVCAAITSPIDGTVIGITSYSSDISGLTGYSGITFKHTTGVSASKVEHTDGARAGNMEADLFLVAAGITEADVLAGKWSHAPCAIFVMNYEAPTMGQLIVNKGFLGEFTQKGQYITVDIRGFNHALQQQIGTVTRAECLHEFGDAGCGLNLAALGFIKTGTLTGVTSQTAFTDSGRAEGAEYFTNGKFLFTSGENEGYEFHIDNWNHSTKTWTLRTSAPYLPEVGDTYSAERGCLKRAAEDCTTKYSNRINFAGFEFLQTMEAENRLPLA